LQYEINMLTMSVGILAYLGTHNNTSPIPWVINNGILNTFAIHARNLIDFLYSRSKKMFQRQRIVVRRLLTRKFRLQASSVAETFITTDNVLNAVPINEHASVTYALGILNSKLISWLYVNTSMIAQKDDFPQVHISALKGLPIPVSDKARHDKMVSLVERMLALHKRTPKTPQEQEMVKREIESTARAIDKLVHELYGLTEDEIRIVEGD
jgi:adenine-specific DNA-methyltransferase